jgi:D-galactonate transporter
VNTNAASMVVGDLPMEQSGAALYGKIAKRIIPVLMVSYLLAYLDRVNVGFAKLQMLNDLKFSEAAYGLGAGIFFIGYLLFEVPSNILMMKIGARKTICRIMILWGLISMGMAFVHTPMQFYVMRFLLGVAEAGFYPGIILYLTFWFPSHTRAKMTALFYTAVPLSGMLGAPLSGWIMESMNQFHGVSGWQWVFLIEGLPSVLLGLAIPKLLHDSPEQAPWLTHAEKSRVRADLQIEADRKLRHTGGDSSILAGLRNVRVWHLTLICLCQAVANYGISFWLPTLIKDLGFTSQLHIGLIAAVPFTAAAITLNLFARSSDRRLERRWHTAIPFTMCAMGLVLSVVFRGNVALSLICLTVAAAGAYSVSAMFWSLPSLFLAGMGMAAAIGLINSLGGLGGFLSPFGMGLIREATGSTAIGVYLVAAFALTGALLTLALPRQVVNR